MKNRRSSTPVPPTELPALAARFQAHQSRLEAMQSATLRDGGPVVARAEAASKAKVYLYDPIGGWWGISPSKFVREINDLDVDEIELHVNSPGGAVYDGLAIMNALRQHDARVVAVVDGIAASAASFIVCGGSDEVVMAENSELMIHDAWGLCVGPAADMHRVGDDLDRLSNNIASIYARKAGGSTADWREVMLEDSFYGAQDAVDAGLADRVLADDDEDDDDQSAAAADIGRWADLFAPDGAFAPAASMNRPAASAAGFTTPVAPAPGETTQEGAAEVFTDEQLTNLRQSLGLPEDADADTILGALNEALQERAGDDHAAVTVTVPEGMVLIEADQLAAMRDDAAAGREARNAQLQAEREDLVAQAVRDGRVSPARRDHWVAQLEADPGVAEVLAGLPRLDPAEEIGYVGSNPGDQEDEESSTTYAVVFPTDDESTKEA